MTETQKESLLYAFDLIRCVKSDIEADGGHKRTIRRLDNALSEIQIAVENESAKERKEKER